MDRIVENEYARDLLVKYVQSHKLPFTASLVSGKHRTTRQNKLQRKWMTEIAEQMEGTFPDAEHVRGYCKLHFGVPILREENEAFRLTYDKRLKPRPYPEKLEFMMEPLSLPVTSIMTTRQKTDYLDRIYKHFTEQGVMLTVPKDELYQPDTEAETPSLEASAQDGGGDTSSPSSSSANPEADLSPASDARVGEADEFSPASPSEGLRQIGKSLLTYTEFLIDDLPNLQSDDDLKVARRKLWETVTVSNAEAYEALSEEDQQKVKEFSGYCFGIIKQDGENSLMGAREIAKERFGVEVA